MPLFDKNMRNMIGDSSSLIRMNHAYSAGTLNGGGVNRPVGSNGASRKVMGNRIFNDYLNIPFESMPAPARTEKTRQTTNYVGGENMVMGRVESPEWDLGFAVPYPQGTFFRPQMAGLAGAAEEELFRTRLHALTKEVASWSTLPLVGTSKATEQATYDKFLNLILYGEQNLSGVYEQAPAALKSEVARWAADRPYSLFGNGADDKSLAKIKERMQAALDRARVVMGLAPAGVTSSSGLTVAQLTSMIPSVKKEEPAPVVARETVLPAAVTSAVKKPMSGKTIALIGAALVATGVAYYYVKKK